MFSLIASIDPSGIDTIDRILDRITMYASDHFRLIEVTGECPNCRRVISTSVINPICRECGWEYYFKLNHRGKEENP